jgi:hypothetical protein
MHSSSPIHATYPAQLILLYLITLIILGEEDKLPHKLDNTTTVTIDILEIRKKINSCLRNS